MNGGATFASGEDEAAGPSSGGPDPDPGEGENDGVSTGMSLAVDAHGITDVGLVRKQNEDAFHVDGSLGLGIVADGMGGAPAGELASALAVETVLGVLRSDARNTSDADLGEAVHRAVTAADEAVRAEGEANPLNRGLGCTLTVLQIDADNSAYAIGHVGDSRAYRYRDGRLVQLTHDHTLAQESVDQGRLPQEALRHHPFGHILTRVIGMSEGAEPQMLSGEALPGDVFFLCTDGVIRVVEEVEIESVLARDLSLPDVASFVVREANERGGPDNSTVVLVRLSGTSSGS